MSSPDVKGTTPLELEALEKASQAMRLLHPNMAAIAICLIDLDGLLHTYLQASPADLAWIGARLLAVAGNTQTAPPAPAEPKH